MRLKVALTAEQIADLYTAYTSPFAGLPNTPDPYDGEDTVSIGLTDRLISGAVSWVGVIDPNIVPPVGYNVYMDPNETKVLNATEATPGVLYSSTNHPRYQL